jgi:hypothetical protein
VTGRRRHRLLVGALTVALVSPVTGAPGGAAAAPPQAPAAAAVEACARPAPADSVRIATKAPQVPHLSPQRAGLARDIAATGERLGVPARGQAIALMAATVGSGLAPANAPRHLFATGLGPRDRGLDVPAFYRRLLASPGWTALPPTLAAHRASGTADPFAYEEAWEPAVLLLSQLAASRRLDVAGAVETGAEAPQRCYASATDPNGLPLPAGSGYAVRAPGRGGTATPAAQGDPGETEFAASCGTPVLAASAGTVQVVRDDRAAGPWKIGVRRASPATTMWYSHVRRPLVRTGSSVLVGQPVAEVGDLGRVDGCRVGLAITVGTGPDARSVDVLPWLTSHGAAVAEPKKPAKKDKKNDKKKGTKGGGPDLPDVVAATTFRAATFNVLGSHLSDPGGDKASYDSGPSRMARGLSVLEASGVSVVAFQEFETPQANAVLADGDWSLQRATPNNRFRNGNAGGNAIAWRRDTWSLVSTGEFTVPWQVTLHMPTVTLRHVDTGAELTVIGVHNPASTDKQGDQQRARDVARGIELSRVRSARSGAPTTPVLLAGDMNERAAVFCGFTGGGLLASFAGGSTGGACRTPAYGGVDWIFGTRDLAFDSWRVNRQTRGSISDHPLVDVQVVIPAHDAG